MIPIVIIPAYNPDEKLLKLVLQLNELHMKVVIVDDGSKPECKQQMEVLAALHLADLCVHPQNRGKGAALKTGYTFAMQRYPDTTGFVTADADGQHSPTDIAKVAFALEKAPDTFILGVRNFNQVDVPFKSRWGNKITSFVFLLSTRKRCKDTQTGLRAIPRHLYEMCQSVPGERYEYEMNFLMAASRQQIAFTYVPIETIYLDENQSSHFHPVRDSIRIYMNIFKYSLSSISSTLLDLTVFTVLARVLGGWEATGLLIATVVARLLSGNLNFCLNRHWVFQSKNQSKEDAIRYFTLFVLQMFLSFTGVSLLRMLPIPITMVKAVVDTTLFFFSYTIQKKHIFHSKEVRSVIPSDTLS